MQDKQLALRFLSRFSVSEVIRSLQQATEIPGALPETLHHLLAKNFDEPLPLHTGERAPWDEPLMLPPDLRRY